MMTMIRLILLALLWPALSGAQVLELTPDTACGAGAAGRRLAGAALTPVAGVRGRGDSSRP